MVLNSKVARPSCAAAAVIAVVISAPHAHAKDVVYDNGAGGAAGINAMYGSDADMQGFAADDVAIGTGAVITGIEWSGGYRFDNTPPGVDDFTIAIYADTSGDGPGVELFSFHVGNDVVRTASGFDFGVGLDIYSFSADVSFVLPANTTLWVSIYANTVGEADTFYWGTLQGQGNTHLSSDFGDTWNQSVGVQDFRLIGTIPAPGALALLGVAGSTTGRRRRRA